MHIYTLHACLFRMSVWAVCKDVKLLFSGAGALGLPWQTQCKEAMPWKWKHDLISHVYLRNHLHDDATVLWFPFGFRVVKLLLPHLLESQDETWPFRPLNVLPKCVCVCVCDLHVCILYTAYCICAVSCVCAYQ